VPQSLKRHSSVQSFILTLAISGILGLGHHGVGLVARETALLHDDPSVIQCKISVGEADPDSELNTLKQVEADPFLEYYYTQ